MPSGPLNDGRSLLRRLALRQLAEFFDQHRHPGWLWVAWYMRIKFTNQRVIAGEEEKGYTTLD